MCFPRFSYLPIVFLVGNNCISNTKEKWGYLEVLRKLEFYRNSITELDYTLNFVNIIRRENDNFDLMLRKRLFCDAKPTVLPCKTAAFGMQNNRFCNTLMDKELSDSYVCEKCLRFYCLLFVRRIM